MNSAGDVHATAPNSMAADHRQRAAADERVDVKPERQTDLPAMEAWLPGITWPHDWALRYRLT